MARMFVSVGACLALLSLACGGGGGGGAQPAAPQPPAVLPPASLAYAANPANYQVGVAIAANAPASAGGVPTAYGVAPPLPAGLSLSPTTGVITGTPTAAAAQAAYTVTATNLAGSTTASLTLTVAAQPAGGPPAPGVGTWSDFGPPLTNGVAASSFCEICVGQGSIFVASVDGIYKSPLDHPAFSYLWAGWPGGVSPAKLTLNQLGNPVVSAVNLSNPTLTQIGQILVWNGSAFVASVQNPAQSGGWWYGIAGGMPLDPGSGALYLAGSLMVMKSTDNGLHFNPLFDLGTLGAGTGSAGAYGYIYALRAMPWGELFIGGETKGYYHSTNGGATWTALPKHDKAGNRNDVCRTKDGEVLMSDCADTSGNFMWRYTSDGQYVPAMTGLAPWAFNNQSTSASNLVYANSGEVFAAVRYANDLTVGHILRWDGAAWTEIGNEPNGPAPASIHANAMGTDGVSIYTQTTAGQVKKWTPAAPLPFQVSLGSLPLTRPASGGSLTGVVTPQGSYTYTWSARSEAGVATFGSPHAPTTTVAFSAAGDYVLNLKASDGAHTAGDSVIVHVP